MEEREVILRRGPKTSVKEKLHKQETTTLETHNIITMDSLEYG